MSAQHTPGPWTVRKARIHFEIWAKTRLIANVRYLAFKGGWTTEIDARLLASAPELLSALERMAFVFQDYEEQHEQNALNEARAAIAKATGAAS